MTTTFQENNNENSAISENCESKFLQTFFQRSPRDRLVRSDSDLEFISSNLPTINEDFKDIRCVSEDDDVFVLSRPVTRESSKINAFHLPPLLGQINLSKSRSPSSPITCKHRPSTPRPGWSSKSVDFPCSSRHGKRDSETQNTSETAKIKMGTDKNKGRVGESRNISGTAATKVSTGNNMREFCETQNIREIGKIATDNSTRHVRETQNSSETARANTREACETQNISEITQSKMDVNNNMINSSTRKSFPLRKSSCPAYYPGKSSSSSPLRQLPANSGGRIVRNPQPLTVLNRQKLDSNSISSSTSNSLLRSRRKASY